MESSTVSISILTHLAKGGDDLCGRNAIAYLNGGRYHFVAVEV